MAAREQLVESERDFQRAVMDLARQTGWTVGHIHDSRRQIAPGNFVGDIDAAGLPDLLLARGGQLIFAELKSQRGRLASGQVRWLDALRQVAVNAPAQLAVHVWRPADWPEIAHTLAPNHHQHKERP